MDHTNALGKQDGMVSAGGNKIPNKIQLSMMKFVKKIDRGDTMSVVSE